VSEQGNKKISQLDRSNYRDLLEKLIIPAIISSQFTDHPMGTCNGVAKDFTLTRDAYDGSLKVFLNGIRLREGLTNDYTIQGRVIRFNTAPITGDILLAEYMPMDM
jgi:hypothetical protein